MCGPVAWFPVVAGSFKCSLPGGRRRGIKSCCTYPGMTTGSAIGNGLPIDSECTEVSDIYWSEILAGSVRGDWWDEHRLGSGMA